MDKAHDGEPAGELGDGPPMPTEARIWADLEQSKKEIAEGRTVPLAPVLDRLRTIAAQMRRERSRVGLKQPME